MRRRWVILFPYGSFNNNRCSRTAKNLTTTEYPGFVSRNLCSRWLTSDLPTRRLESKLADLAEHVFERLSHLAGLFVGKGAFHRPDQAKLKWSFRPLNCWIWIKNQNRNHFMAILMHNKTFAKEVQCFYLQKGGIFTFAHNFNSWPIVDSSSIFDQFLLICAHWLS